MQVALFQGFKGIAFDYQGCFQEQPKRVKCTFNIKNTSSSKKQFLIEMYHSRIFDSSGKMIRGKKYSRVGDTLPGDIFLKVGLNFLGKVEGQIVLLELNVRVDGEDGVLEFRPEVIN